MTGNKIDRKIAVIFVTDVVGFSKLMEKHEDQTLKSFRSCKEILDTLFLEHGGRIFNTAGDSVLAEFQSAVSAVVCASEFQKLISERNKNVNEDAEMHFRIGINMGDVIIEGTNLYGDGVNVAASLEALCLPDSVCLSKSIHDFVSKKTELIFHDLGDQKVKNTVVHAFDMDLAGKERRTIEEQVDTFTESNKPPSIAVLPFLNLSNDPDQDYFADGITEDIISNLSLWKTFPVISRNSSFSFKGKNLKSSEIAQQLGVKYLVEGSVRKGGEKVRITAQLIDAAEDKQIWSKKWDRSLDDIFEVQDEVSQGVAAMVSPAVKGQEIIKSASNSNKKNYGAWDEYLKALSFYNSEKKEDRQRVFDQCQKAIDLDPSLSDPLVLQTRILVGQIFSSKKDEKRKKNEELFHTLATKAVELDPKNPEALIALSRSYNIKRDFEKRISLAKKALEINPSHAGSNFDYGQAISSLGRYDEAVEYVQKAMELDPSGEGNYKAFYVLLYFANGDYEQSLDCINFCYDRDKHSRYLGWRAAIYGLMGRLEDAKQQLNLFLIERPEIKSIADYKEVAPIIMGEKVLEGILLAGMPEA